MWGLMSPIGKDAMQHGIDNINLVFMRAAGGALLFWITSLFCEHEHMPWRDILAMSGAGLRDWWATNAASPSDLASPLLQMPAS